MESRSDKELVDHIVNQQVASIRRQRKFKGWPMWWHPPLPLSERAKRDEEWQEAIRRNLHHEINQRVQETLDENEGGNDEN